MSICTNDDQTMLGFHDVTLDYFRPLVSEYPNLVFTNIDQANNVQKKAVYVFPKDLPRRGNVFIELWQHKDSFHFIMKKSIMTEEEKAESVRKYRRDTPMRGGVERCMTYKRELLDYIIPKLNMIETAK